MTRGRQVIQLGILTAALATACSVGGARAAAIQHYTMQPIDPPTGYAAFHPYAINASGEVVGTVVDPFDGTERAAVWRNGTATTLPTLGGSRSAGLAISDSGIVAGESATKDDAGEVHASVWYGEDILDLGVGGSESSATGVNSAGTIVGYERDHLGSPHAMRWEAAVGQRVDRFEQGFSSAAAINEQGDILVSAYTKGPGGRPDSYIWRGGPLAWLGAFQATALNEEGEAIGYEATPLPDVTGVVWTAGVVESLGNGHVPMLPLGLNDRGQVVGMMWSSTADERAFLWEHAGTVVDLNEAVQSEGNWQLRQATAINNTGQIVGDGAWKGQERAWMLTPDEIRQ